MALRTHGLGFIQCIVGVRVLTDLSLVDAKVLVHNSEAYADSRGSREAMWEAIQAEVMTLPVVEDAGTAGSREGP